MSSQLPDLNEYLAKQFDIKKAVQMILVAIGEDPEREGLLNTPDRVARMYEELTEGYEVDLNVLLNGALFEVDYDEMVVVKDIDFYSFCEHHILPFYGRAHVAYLPDGKVVGLSKIPRIVDMYARRLQLQERMTQQIAKAIDGAISPLGVGVVVEAQHLCCAMRGVEKHNARMVTSAMFGCFRDDNTAKAELMGLIGK